jgi:DNA-binding transcriptional regulator PaaX
MYKFGSVQQKILLVLAGGVALGFSSDSRQYFKTLRNLQKEWKKIDQRSFNRSIRRLSEEKFVTEKRLHDGSYKLVLTEEGKKQAKVLNFLGKSIEFKKPKRWDGKWRIVLFDIPEKDRIFRAVLREHLYTLKFHKLQHSVFVSPHPCEESISDLVALYSAEPYVRIITASKIDNEKILKNIFHV